MQLRELITEWVCGDCYAEPCQCESLEEVALPFFRLLQRFDDIRDGLNWCAPTRKWIHRVQLVPFAQIHLQTHP